MGFDKNEMIEQLKFKMIAMEKGGYDPSVRDPRHNPEIFRESVTCLNAGLEEKDHACTSCFLSEFASPHTRNETGDLCQKIPLNVKGDTIESLKAEGDLQKLQDAVLGWVKRTVAKLEGEASVGK